MKKSVNGKSFDEIFEERGDNIKFNEMVQGDIYLNHRWYKDGTNIFRFHEFDRLKHIISDSSLFESGGAYHGISGHSVVDDRDKYFVATHNQIDLLNSYK